MNYSMIRRVVIYCLLITLVACQNVGIEIQNDSSTEQPFPFSIEPTPIATVTLYERPKIQATEGMMTSSPYQNRMIGTGLREQTASLLLKYRGCEGLTMASSSTLAQTHFEKLDGWIRVLGAPSLKVLENKAVRATLDGIPYEALGYGLETSKSTPEDEWRNLLDSTQSAKFLAKEYDKLLLMGPGFQLMSKNEFEYSSMAMESDIWMLQTQQLQKLPPGKSYRDEVERIVNIIRSANPKISIWAQITFPPDRAPNASEWMRYREQVIDLVEGTYVGIYTWDTVDNQVLTEQLELIFLNICGN